MKIGMLVTGYHEKNSNVIHLFFRTLDGKKVEKVIKDFYPYFYVEFSQGQYESLTGEKLMKITCEYPEELKEKRKGYKKTYEADVLFVLRYLIDKGITSYVNLDTLEPVNNVNVFIKPRLVYLDIENVDEDLICWTVWDSYIDQYVTCVLADFDDIKEEGNRVKIYMSDEYELTRTLCDVLTELNPDVIGGWNIAYDVDFLKQKFRRCGFRFNFANCDYFDLYSAYMRLYKALSTRLKDVAVEEGLAESPLEWEDAYEAWKNGDYDKMIEYNWHDVYYCVEIDRKRKIFDFFWSIKQLVGEYRLYTGNNYEVIKTGSIVDVLMLRFAKKMNKVLLTSGLADPVPYEGAAVLDPVPGRHKNLAVYDFGRTYPTIIIALNISPETKIKVNGKIDFDKSKKALLPMVCEYLLEERERIEKEMKKYDPYTEEWLNLKMKRDAVKYATNAVYGYTGWTHARIYDVDIASTITGVARDLMLYLVKYCKEELGLEVVYGDSVLPDTPIIVRENGKIEVITFDELWNRMPIRRIRNDGKIEGYPKFRNIEVLTEKGWTKLKKVIKHKVNKTIYGIQTRTAYIEVTEDHSLVVNGKEVTPKEIERLGKIELVDFQLPEIYDIDEDIAWLYGFWIGDGTCGEYYTKCNVKRTWRIDNQDLQKLEKALVTLRKMDYDGKIYDIRSDIASIVDKFVSECINVDGTKRIPYFILMGTRKVKEAFLQGFIDADGHIEKRTKIVELTNIDKTVVAGLCLIIKSLGYKYSIKTREDKPNAFVVRIIRNPTDMRIEPEYRIKKIRKFKYEGWVYDIETENHHFVAGIGNVLLHNTDSTIVKIPFIDKFDESYIKDLEKFGKMMTEAVSKYFREKYDARRNIKTKFERFAKMGYFPPVKKRYALRVIWEDKPCNVIVIKGFEAIRTDASKFTREFMKKLFEMILDETKTKEDIRKFVKETIEKIKEMDLETICFRKGLSKNPEEYDNPQDYVRAALYSNKYLGTNFRKGSKVKYIYVKKTKGIPYTDVIGFEYVKQIEGKIEIDWDRVIEKSIYMPAEDILEDLGIYSIQRRGLTVKDIVEMIKKRKKNK